MGDALSIRFVLNPDVLIRRHKGALLMSNPRTRTHVEVTRETLDRVLQHADGAEVATWGNALKSRTGWDRTSFDITRGLWSDHSGLADSRGKEHEGESLYRLLHKRWIVCAENAEDYYEFLAPLTTVLDRKHLGTFHQRVGQTLALEMRLRENWRWWHNQKFREDGLGLNPSPYAWVQDTFFNAYYGAQDLKGAHVLDFACGNGYFSNKFAGMGASVVGIDTSAQLIDLAKRNFGSGARFYNPSSNGESLAIMESMPAGSIDLIYMSDVMLILVELALRDGERPALRTLLAAFKRLLSSNGRIEMMEPNSQYWLGGLYGDPNRPYTIVPEYRERMFNVAPTIDQYVEVMSAAGFAMVGLIHPRVDAAETADCDFLARSREFPLWDFMSFVSLKAQD
jgi:SAM-dependent methyltransferase